MEISGVYDRWPEAELRKRRLCDKKEALSLVAEPRLRTLLSHALKRLQESAAV
jgi:hypothetical protein